MLWTNPQRRIYLNINNNQYSNINLIQYKQRRRELKKLGTESCNIPTEDIIDASI